MVTFVLRAACATVMNCSELSKSAAATTGIRTRIEYSLHAIAHFRLHRLTAIVEIVL